MAYINNTVFDNGLGYVTTNGTRLDICSQEPISYAGATSTFSLGNKTALIVSAAQAGAIDGRRVIIPTITDGSVTVSGTATHWALTNGSSVLIATGTLTPSVAVTSGNIFTLDAISLTIRAGV